MIAARKLDPKPRGPEEDPLLRALKNAPMGPPLTGAERAALGESMLFVDGAAITAELRRRAVAELRNAPLATITRLVDADPKAFAIARTLADCDRDDAFAEQLAAALATLNNDPNTAVDLLDRARAWHRSLGEALARRRRFVTDAHELPAQILASHGTETTPESILDNPFCQALAEISDEEIECDRRAAEDERRMRAELFGNDRELERQAWKAGTHPMHPNSRAPAP